MPHRRSEPPALTAQQQARRAHAQAARQTRRQLEKRIAQPDRRVAKEIWTKLGHEDPWIRHAARAALEKAPADAWRDAALKEASLDENEIDATLSARIALARMTPESPPPVDNFKARFTEASERNKLEMLYLAARSLKQRPDENTLADLRSLYPDTSCPVNVRLSQILSDDPDAEFVAKTLSLLERATAQREQLHYLFVLRHVQTGWTPAWRQTYFAHLQQMDDFVGGEGLPTFRKLIRQEAVAALPADERAKYEKLLEAQTPRWIAELPPARTDVVQTWTVDELAKAWATSKTQRDPANGKKMFAVARCLACHRCGGEGGVSGPDLSSVAQRFSPRDILTAIVEPSRVISEKYAAETFELESGRVITGRIAPGDYRSPQLEIVPNLMEPETTVTVAKADIAARTTSPVSPMPTGLLDTLNQEEILDLLAFLLQGDAERASAASP